MIRPLVTADMPALWRLNQENVPAVGEETEAALATLLEQCSIALGVELDGVLVGFCFVLPPGRPYASENYRWFCARYDSFVYLDRVAFTAAFQGRGLGAALYAEVRARAGDAQRLVLEVNLEPRNDGSLRFHAREGFVEVGQQRVKGKLVSLLSRTL